MPEPFVVATAVPRCITGVTEDLFDQVPGVVPRHEANQLRTVNVYLET